MERYKAIERVVAFAMVLPGILPAVSSAAPAHVHGAATLQVAIEGGSLALDFESPLDNLVGFERAPRSDKEKKAVRDMTERLHKPELLFVPTPEARCVRESVKVSAPVLEGEKPERSGHAGLSAVALFRCAEPRRLAGLEVKIFDAFPHISRLDVQVAGAAKQVAVRLSRKDRRVSW